MTDTRAAAEQLAEAIGEANCPHCGERSLISAEHLDRKFTKGGIFPQLLWEGPDIDGDYIVSLVGLPREHLAMHGHSVALVLARLGAVLTAVFGDPT